MRLGEAVALGSAWTHQIARTLGIRALLIKGDTLHQHGLRPARVSADVDVLVEPDRFEEYCQAMAAAGWRERPVPLISHQLSSHSRAYVHDSWPCDIDVHRYYPGFLKEAAEVFDVLWSRRGALEFAHTRVESADRPSSILILALHSLRDGRVNARHQEELEHLTSLELTAEERRDLGMLALQTGSAATLAEVLPRFGVEVEPDRGDLESPALRDWRGRVESKSEGAYAWSVALSSAKWRDRPLIVWNAFWPAARELRLSHPQIGPGSIAVFGARVARWRRGMRGLPRSLRALKSRRG